MKNLYKITFLATMVVVTRKIENYSRPTKIELNNDFNRPRV
ncbi:hypothetical protein [Staphylococcus xylosus]|nr:hypothetical protein [Staphylococcus xylosus]